MNNLILPLQFYYEKGRGKNKKSGLAAPTWNHTYVYRKGRPILTKWAFDYQEKIRAMTKEWAEENNWHMTKKKKVIVNIWVFHPNRIKRDCHNLLKILIDALEGTIFEDDYYALVRIQNFHIDKENPRFELSFEEVEDDE